MCVCETVWLCERVRVRVRVCAYSAAVVSIHLMSSNSLYFFLIFFFVNKLLPVDRSNIFCHIKCIKFNWLIFWPCVKTERQSSWWEGTYLTFIAYEIARVTEWWRADLFCVNSPAIMQISLYFPPPTIFGPRGAALMCVAFPRASAQYWLIYSSRKVCDVMKQTTAVMQHQWRVWKSLSANERKAEGITVWWEGFLRIDGVAWGCCCVCVRV